MLLLFDSEGRASCAEKHPNENGGQVVQVATSVELVHGDGVEEFFKEKAVEGSGLEGVDLVGCEGIDLVEQYAYFRQIASHHHHHQNYQNI